MQTLQYGEDGAVATIRLHRPEKKNSLNAEMRHEMASLLNDLARKAGHPGGGHHRRRRDFLRRRGYQRDGRATQR